MHFKIRSAFFFEMTGKEIIQQLEQWAPKGIAWEKDNVGLQVGNLQTKVKNILLSLDLSDKVIEAAKKDKCNLIITHHPLLFQPLKSLNFTNTRNSKMIETLIKNDITLYSAHTNLDFTKEGVSYQLARKLGLINIRFLKNLSHNQFKLVVFVPESHLSKVADAIHKAGGGIIGEYSHCSFNTKGKGTFKGSDRSNPVIGQRNLVETVDEIKLEIIVDKWNLNSAIDYMRSAHPYEEVAFDVYPLQSENVNYGIGAIGELKQSLNSEDFFEYVSSKMKIQAFRHTKHAKNRIKTVAVCGGSCSELIDESINQKADAFITADIKYHSFQDAENKILLIDAGHYETEVHVLDEIKKRLEIYLKKNKSIKVLKFKGSTNPIIFYNNSGAN